MGGRSAQPVNFAFAYSHDCTVGCESVAVAYQVALVDRRTQLSSPQNGGVAVNQSCSHCATFAYAYQDVEQVPSGTHLTGAAKQEIARIRQEVQADIHRDEDFTALDAQLKALAGQLHAAVVAGLDHREHHEHSSQVTKRAGPEPSS